MLRLLKIDNECPVCVGSGGWPHPLKPEGFEKCKVCNGTGKRYMKQNQFCST